MPQPVTTSELLLEQAVGLLTEIRDLLRDGKPVTANPPVVTLEGRPMQVRTESSAATPGQDTQSPTPATREAGGSSRKSSPQRRSSASSKTSTHR